MMYDKRRRRVGVAAAAAAALALTVLWAVRSGDAGVTARRQTIRVAVVDLKQVTDTCVRARDLRLDSKRSARPRSMPSAPGRATRSGRKA